MSLTVIRQRMGKASVQCLMIGLALSALLAGCSSAPKGGVRVVDRNGNNATASATPQKPMTTTGQHVVAKGDTLFSIAFRYGWDWKALAARNNIPEPYTIHVGQAIRFDSRSNSTPTAVASTASAASTASPSGKFTITRHPANSASTPATAAQPATQAPPAATPSPPAGPAPKGWAWPSNGILIGKFSSNGSLNKGIDIAGDLGQPVLAASDGSVVYAGSGLRGYGELVIIKHSDTYVSAYGHNRRLLVREGQQVKVGQTIAEMGSTGTDRVKLHFEIRRQGKPVDPLQFLPRR
ncbi:peptidoglycan DD-metalloendopeptidase family protein [Pseudomonas sp. FEN]|uniref:peptidoglycan DD-metalloendopeptidase family protein n=1 Tax=Pseudomonas sp. FEN TaxID=2767468 RepID=UPI00174B455D|nr:peptidoglycan DD-metalloendopeptidase family protein [Pseudomonas sp. FEN]